MLLYRVVAIRTYFAYVTAIVTRQLHQLLSICTTHIQHAKANGEICMKQSKLELYIDILKALNQRSQNSTNLLSEIKIDYNTMNNRMDFLMKQQLITKRNRGNQVVFKNTKKGKNILRYFKEIENRTFIVDVGIEVADYKKSTQML